MRLPRRILCTYSLRDLVDAYEVDRVEASALRPQLRALPSIESTALDAPPFPLRSKRADEIIAEFLREVEVREWLPHYRQSACLTYEQHLENLREFLSALRVQVLARVSWARRRLEGYAAELRAQNVRASPRGQMLCTAHLTDVATLRAWVDAWEALLPRLPRM